MIYRRRPYSVEAKKMANGNWLVENANGSREVWSPEAFEASFEQAEPLPAYVCSVCRAELVYDTGAQALVCRRCRG